MTGDWLASLDSSQAALRSDSILRSQLISGLQLPMFWATISNPAVAKGKVVVATADGQVICVG